MKPKKTKQERRSKELQLLTKAANSLIVGVKALKRSQELLAKTEGFSYLIQKAGEK